MIFNIPVSQEHIRSIKDPNDENTRIAHALINVNDLPLDIPLDPDPRAPKEKGAVPQQIVRSLKTNDGRFHLLNRGITISVKKYIFDNQKNVLSLDLPPEEQYGIIDGGHTYFAIGTNVQREKERLLAESEDGSNSEDLIAFPDQYVHVEILERIEKHLADIAEARNFSVQLKSWTLANYRDKFDWLLKSLGQEYVQHIKVRENDEQPVGILDVIQILSAVNPILFGEEKPAIESYKNVGKCLEWFVDEEDKYGFRKFEPIAQDILRLYDFVRFNFKEKYNTADETGKGGRFGARREAKERKRGSRRMSTYYFLEPDKGPVQGEVPIEKGFALPLISGFRVLVQERKGKFEWVTDPFKFFDVWGTKLVRTIMNSSDLAGGDPHVVGRDPQAYRQMTSEVRRWYLEGELAKRNGAKR
jgi:AIPR protein